MSGIYREDDWSVGEAQIDGLPLIVRSRSTLPAMPDRQVNENLIIISWSYSANASGMPLHEDNQSTIRFEDAIEEALEADGVGVHAATVTGNGIKEWRYYTYDADKFMSQLNQGLIGHPAYPIEIKVFNDPDWTALAELLPK